MLDTSKFSDAFLSTKYREFLNKDIEEIYPTRDYPDLKLKEKYKAFDDIQEKLYCAIEEDAFRNGFLYGYACGFEAGQLQSSGAVSDKSDGK